jgi:cbb3-type cytochrome oxidase subunit 3
MKLTKKGYALGLPALAWAFIIVFIIILVIAFVPQVKEAVLELLNAIFKKS